MHVEAIPLHTDVTLDPQELQSPQTLCSHRVAGSLKHERDVSYKTGWVPAIIGPTNIVES